MERYLRTIERVFGRGEGQPRSSVHRSHETNGVTPVPVPGFEHVWHAAFFPSNEMQWVYRSGSVPGPDRCCFCNAPTAKRAPCMSAYPRLCDRLFGRDTGLECPSCDEHTDRGRSKILIDICDLRTPYLRVECFGVNESFLEECLRRSTDGEYAPPWHVFPGSVPYLRWNQGIRQMWIRSAWAPFWWALSQNERIRYLKKWEVPHEWKAAIESRERPLWQILHGPPSQHDLNAE